MIGTKSKKLAKTPKNPFDKERLLAEAQLLGRHGLKNKHELWVMQTEFCKHKQQARELLICNDKSVVIVKGRQFLDGLCRNGFMSEVDYNSVNSILLCCSSVLTLCIDRYLERRLQFRVYAAGLACSVHQARVYIYSGKIVVKGKVIKRPGYIVQADEEAFLELNPLKLNKSRPKRAEAEVVE